MKVASPQEVAPQTESAQRAISSIVSAPQTLRLPPELPGPIAETLIATFFREEAIKAIEDKARELGPLPGPAHGDVERIPYLGWVGRYEGCDIYYTGDLGAHEVHGDIRRKYDLLGGAAGALGLPRTDETSTPDSVGRYNHFSGGSIYWSPSTGPMMVRGGIRNVWASLGWERGWLGYPVADEYRFRSVSPATDPALYWSLFENGAIVSSNDGTAVALAATVTPAQLCTFVRRKFDEVIHRSPDNLGLHPQRETIAVSGWQYGFWNAQSRIVTFRIHGFRDNGLLADANFTVDLSLRFYLTWDPTFTEPATKHLVAEHHGSVVQVSGIGAQEIANGLATGIRYAFSQPLKLDDIPTGVSGSAVSIDVIDVLTTKDGGLQVLLNPLPAVVGRIRQSFAQQHIDQLLSGG